MHMDYEAKRDKNKQIKFRIAIAVSAMALAAILFLVSPYFFVQEVIITGYSRVPRQEINNRLGISASTNLLFFNTNAARHRLMENLFIGHVTFERTLPNRLHVQVHERRLTAYFEHSPGSFLFLDDMGRVLDVRTYFTEPLPMLGGLRLNHFQLGEILDVPDTASFGAVVQYAQLLYFHGLIDRVTHLNVSDPQNIRIMVNHLEFNVGNVHGADEKVRTIVEILNNLPNADMIRGTIPMREISNEYFLKIIQ